MASSPLQTARTRLFRLGEPADAVRGVERWLEAERDQLPLWVPVLYGSGIAAWAMLGRIWQWQALAMALVAMSLLGWLAPAGSRLRMVLVAAPLLMAAGMGSIWLKSSLVAAPVIERPVMVDLTARVLRIEERPAQNDRRLTLAPLGRVDLPPRVRVSERTGASTAVLTVSPGDVVTMRARLMPPPGAMLPGGYDFQRRAWFDGLGAVGSVTGPIALSAAGSPDDDRRLLRWRHELGDHVASRTNGQGAGIAVAFVNGDRGRITPLVEDEMRASGLTHLLSISGLHVTAVVAGAMLLVVRLLALHPPLAWRWPLWTIGAGAGAAAGIGYTLLTGAEVPTVRSCIGAVIVLAALAAGREALTMRLIATAALAILLAWPDALLGASFQLSFAAVVAIVLLHDSGFARRHLTRRDEPRFEAVTRLVGGLVLTGLVIEAMLAPIALFHFHRTGLYGALANAVAIPLTTFVAMPGIALGLLLDAPHAATGGIVPLLGAPGWAIADGSLSLLVDLSSTVANLPGAVRAWPVAPTSAFALIIIGGLWLVLWRTRWRWAGALPVLLGVVLMITARPPDLLVSREGRHVAQRLADGRVAMLRLGSSDFVNDGFAETGATTRPLVALRDHQPVDCNRDVCRWTVQPQAGRGLVILAGLSSHALPEGPLASACADADIVVMPRYVGTPCKPRLLFIDRERLDQHGGVAIDLSDQTVTWSRDPLDDHPWTRPPTVTGQDEPQ